MEHALDHLVINSHFDIDALAEVFQALGFRLTPRGYHSLGSLNHLMMFDSHYLEIIGLPGEGKLRQEILNSPQGIDGLVFSSQDAAATRQFLEEAGFSLQPLQHFSREVVDGTVSGTARFTTLRLLGDEFSAGRVYFCQHHTPEWVWRPGWPGHANGVTGICALSVVTKDPQAEKRHYQRLGKIKGDFELRFITRSDALASYTNLLHLPAERENFFSVIHLRGGDPDLLTRAAARLSLPFTRSPGCVRIALPVAATLLEFLS